MIRRIIKTYINVYKSHNLRFLSSVSKLTRIQDKPPIIITPAAASRINDIMLLQNPIPLGIRVGIRKRGCNGLSYTMEYIMDNSDAYYCYKKIFGKEYRKDERYAYFSYKL